MTDNQITRMFDLLTKCVDNIQDPKVGQERLEVAFTELKTDATELKTDVAELKTDVGDLKEGQNRLEKHLRIKDSVIDSLAGEQIRLQATLTEMEKSAV